MSTKRTPLRRDLWRKITPEAIEAFRQVEAATTDDEWWYWHSVLHGAIGAKPWEWPCFEYPDAECPYPPGCAAAAHWQHERDERPEAFELYYALQKAAAGK